MNPQIGMLRASEQRNLNKLNKLLEEKEILDLELDKTAKKITSLREKLYLLISN